MRMQTKATIEATLSALAHIDNGSLALTLDKAVYSESSVLAFVAACGPHCRASLRQASGALHLQLVASDPKAARLQIGNALTDLLACSLRATR
jgi:hypothetical protein